MRKALRDIQHIERFLQGSLSPEAKQSFQMRINTDPALRRQVARQRETYQLIRQYGRIQLSRELNNIHRRLMKKPSFRRRVMRAG